MCVCVGGRGAKSDCMILYGQQQPCIYDPTDLASNALKFWYTYLHM